MIKCAIFDFNGTTILDSAVQKQSWIAYVSKLVGRQISVDEYQQYIHGQSNLKVFTHFLNREMSYEEMYFYGNQKEKEYRDLCVLHKDIVTLAKGIEECWDYFKENGVTLNIGTNAPMVNMEFAFDFYGLGKWFDIGKIVVDDGVIKTKPAPDTYTLALDKVSAKGEETIVFEDTMLGLESAVSANIGICVLMDYEHKVSSPLVVNGKEILIYHDFYKVIEDIKKGLVR